ncbi:MAG: ATP-binding cassette domain-containing protein [Actinomycetaceae bacterium]|nr:ATP-binding cassette domain-containing protein [Actinomycetaceae bacterium]
MTTLEARNLGKVYGQKAPVRALHNVNLRINQGEYVAIVGPSGSGKSTLLNQLALLDTPTEGDYYIDGERTANLSDQDGAKIRSDNFAFIFQSFHLLGGRNVRNNVALGTLYRGLAQEEREKLAEDALAFVGLSHKVDTDVALLSGGERQRVAIARAISSGAPVLFADEPTGNLDSASSRAIMDVLEKLHEGGTTIVIVTHDPNVAARAHRCLRVQDGIVTEDPQASLVPVESFPASPADSLTGSRIVSSADDPAGSRAGTPEQGITAVGRPSTMKFWEGVKDAWAGLLAKPSRTAALVGAVTLGVALALTTLGLAQSARAQVSELFDAQRNTRVAMSVAGLDGNSFAAKEALSESSLRRIKDLAGVTDALLLVGHNNAAVRAVPDVSEVTTADLMGLVGKVGGKIIKTTNGKRSVSSLADGEALVGKQLAGQIQLGPLLGSPTIWVAGRPLSVVGIIEDAGLQVKLLNSVVTNENTAASLGKINYASVEMKVVPGAAAQVAKQGPAAWIPASDRVNVNAPPDPKGMRQQIEASLATVLMTLTGVTLLASILMLTNTMTTAVFQRAGEFGLRRAMGGRKKHVTALVLTESVMTGTLGGVIGAYVAIMAVLVVTIARSWQPVFDMRMVPVAIVGGTLVGLIGGTLATWRASRIQPSDALRA